jgi:hypothetical protein
MARKFWLRQGVIVLAIALPSGLGRAQEVVEAPPPPAAPLAPAPLAPAPAPGPGTTPDGRWFPYGPLEVQEVSAASPRPRRPVNTFLRHFNACCWSDINHVGCGSLKSECNYVFGSCRSFYKEQCEAPQPHPWSRNAGNQSQGCGCGD